MVFSVYHKTQNATTAHLGRKTGMGRGGSSQCRWNLRKVLTRTTPVEGHLIPSSLLFSGNRHYAAIVYLRTTNSTGDMEIAIVIAKTKVAPIERLTIPRLELCGAFIFARMLKHAADILDIATSDIYWWIDR